ncbi:hypothetical protein [Exiguobacterium sp. s50]|uniref:hypothetical protein n=1 Tax=Exiguobacterium sp. s50 TaxID=2751234 RepID=UPI001BE6F025|nr:hypothetical protein [Exiguobacterium sp. s50]
MNDLGEQLKRWTESTASHIEKWMRGMDSMLGQALADWVAQEKRVIAFQKQTREVEDKLKKHDLVIQELITRLYQHDDSQRLNQQARFQQTLREKVNRIETLHRELQEKEEVVMKSHLAVQQLLFKVDESKSRETKLQEDVEKQKMKLQKFHIEKNKLENQIKEMTSKLSDDNLQANAKVLFKAQIQEAEKRIEEIEAREQSVCEQNKRYEEELQKVRHQKLELDQKVAQMEVVRDALLTDKQKLLHDVASHEKQIQFAIQESECLQKQLQTSREEQEAAYSLWSEELEKRSAIELEKEKINRQYDEVIEQWSLDKKKHLQKEMRLQKKIGRRVGGSIPNIYVEKEFEKDYLELSEQEQTGVDAALYELSLGWHTGNVTFRPNSVKGKSTTYKEYGWGSSHRIPGRLYVKREQTGYRVYRISRTKDGNHRLSQTRVIEWIKNQ